MRGITVDSTGTNHRYYKRKPRSLTIENKSGRTNSEGLYEIDHFRQISGKGRSHQFNKRITFDS